MNLDEHYLYLTDPHCLTHFTLKQSVRFELKHQYTNWVEMPFKDVTLGTSVPA